MKKILSVLLLSSTFIIASASCLPVWGSALQDELDAVEKSSLPSSSNSAPLTDIEKAIQDPEWQKEFKNALQTNPHLVPEMATVVGLSDEQYYYLAKFYSPHDDIVDPSRFELETLKGWYKLSNPEHFKKIVANVGVQDEQGIFSGFLTYNKKQLEVLRLSYSTGWKFISKTVYLQRLAALLMYSYVHGINTSSNAESLERLKDIILPSISNPSYDSSVSNYVSGSFYEHGIYKQKFILEKNVKKAEEYYYQASAYYDTLRVQRSGSHFGPCDISPLLGAIHHNRDLRAAAPLYRLYQEDQDFLIKHGSPKKDWKNDPIWSDETRAYLANMDLLSHIKYAAIAGNNKEAQDILIQSYATQPHIQHLLMELQKKQGHVE